MSRPGNFAGSSDDAEITPMPRLPRNPAIRATNGLLNTETKCSAATSRDGARSCCFLLGPIPCIPDDESRKGHLDDSEEDVERPVPHRDQDNQRIDHAKDDVEPAIQAPLRRH